MNTLNLKNLETITGGKVRMFTLTSSFLAGATLMYGYQQMQMPEKIYLPWHEMRGPARKTIHVGDTKIKLYDLN